MGEEGDVPLRGGVEEGFAGLLGFTVEFVAPLPEGELTLTEIDAGPVIGLEVPFAGILGVGVGGRGDETFAFGAVELL